ncbi:MAG: hypothetical protein ACP5F9_04185 [Thiomonas sp.]
MRSHPPLTARGRGLVALCLMGLCAAMLPAHAQSSTDALPSLTAGPDDLMRILPAQLLAGLQPVCDGVRTAAPPWSAQLEASVALLHRLNQASVPAAQAVLPTDMLCSRPRALAAAWMRAADRASNLVQLDFAGGPTLAGPAAEGEAAVVGASFIGASGSRVLVINRGAQPVRVLLGSWIGKTARLDQYTAPDATQPAQVRHLRRAIGPQDAQGIVLPPLSLSVIG